MNLIIRRSVPADLPSISKIEKQVFTDAWSDESLLFEIENGQFICLSAELTETGADAEEGTDSCKLPGSRIFAGYLMALAIPDVEVQLCNIAVDPEFRRSGIASAMMQVLLDISAEIDALEVTLEVRVSNMAARALYESFGFEKTGLRRNYYSDGEDAILMSRTIQK